MDLHGGTLLPSSLKKDYGYVSLPRQKTPNFRYGDEWRVLLMDGLGHRGTFRLSTSPILGTSVRIVEEWTKIKPTRQMNYPGAQGKLGLWRRCKTRSGISSSRRPPAKQEGPFVRMGS